MFEGATGLNRFTWFNFGSFTRFLETQSCYVRKFDFFPSGLFRLCFVVGGQLTELPLPQRLLRGSIHASSGALTQKNQQKSQKSQKLKNIKSKQEKSNSRHSRTHNRPNYPTKSKNQAKNAPQTPPKKFTKSHLSEPLHRATPLSGRAISVQSPQPRPTQPPKPTKLPPKPHSEHKLLKTLLNGVPGHPAQLLHLRRPQGPQPHLQPPHSHRTGPHRQRGILVKLVVSERSEAGLARLEPQRLEQRPQLGAGEP